MGPKWFIALNLQKTQSTPESLTWKKWQYAISIAKAQNPYSFFKMPLLEQRKNNASIPGAVVTCRQDQKQPRGDWCHLTSTF